MKKTTEGWLVFIGTMMKEERKAERTTKQRESAVGKPM